MDTSFAFGKELEMIKMYLLGTASGIPTENRYCESVALVINEDIYLLDAGEPCSASLIRKGINYNKIKTIFISHMHADHFSGVPMLLQLMQLKGKYGKRKDNLSLFIPHESINSVKKYLETIYLMQELLPYKLNILPIDNALVYSDKNLEVVAYPNAHLNGLKEIKEQYPLISLESFSYLVKMGDKKIAYSGDIKDVEELSRFIDGVDLLLVEMAHITPETLFSFLANHEISRIICLHIGPAWDNKDEIFLKLGRKYLGNNVRIGYDGMKLEL